MFGASCICPYNMYRYIHMSSKRFCRVGLSTDELVFQVSGVGGIVNNSVPS